MKDDYQKALKKSTLFFLLKKLLKKRGLELVTSHSSAFRKIQKHSSIRYILADQVWWCNVKQFLSYCRSFICKFMQVSSWHHKLFHFHLPFWIWKVWKGREKIAKNWICRERKELFNSFLQFLKGYYWVKK